MGEAHRSRDAAVAAPEPPVRAEHVVERQPELLERSFALHCRGGDAHAASSPASVAASACAVERKRLLRRSACIRIVAGMTATRVSPNDHLSSATLTIVVSRIDMIAPATTTIASGQTLRLIGGSEACSDTTVSVAKGSPPK